MKIGINTGNQIASLDMGVTCLTSLKALNYDGRITIEAFCTIIPDFANAINVWRDFSATEEIYQEGFKFISPINGRPLRFNE